MRLQGSILFLLMPWRFKRIDQAQADNVHEEEGERNV